MRMRCERVAQGNTLKSSLDLNFLPTFACCLCQGSSTFLSLRIRSAAGRRSHVRYLFLLACTPLRNDPAVNDSAVNLGVVLEDPL
jgi:hypothetical protein